MTTLPAAGTVRLNGTAVTAGQYVSAADIGSGLLVFQPAANGNGTPYTSFTFQVQDDGGTANGGADLDASPNTLTFNVTAVNDTPSFTKGADQTVVRDTGAYSIANWATNRSPGPTTRWPDADVHSDDSYAYRPVHRGAGDQLHRDVDLHPQARRHRHEGSHRQGHRQRHSRTDEPRPDLHDHGDPASLYPGQLDRQRVDGHLELAGFT